MCVTPNVIILWCPWISMLSLIYRAGLTQHQLLKCVYIHNSFCISVWSIFSSIHDMCIVHNDENYTIDHYSSAHNICSYILQWYALLPRPRRGSRGIVFTRSVCVSVCLCVYLCVRPIFWYFISRLLDEISIWNLYRILIWLYSIH